jgi:hypothetical protein
MLGVSTSRRTRIISYPELNVLIDDLPKSCSPVQFTSTAFMIYDDARTVRVYTLTGESIVNVNAGFVSALILTETGVMTVNLISENGVSRRWIHSYDFLGNSTRVPLSTGSPELCSMVFSKDGSVFYGATKTGIHVYSTATGELMDEFVVNEGATTFCAFSEIVVSDSNDVIGFATTGSIVLIRIRDRKILRYHVPYPRFFFHGNEIACVPDRTPNFILLSLDLKETRRFQHSVFCGPHTVVGFDGVDVIAVLDNTVFVLNTENGHIAERIRCTDWVNSVSSSF